MIREFYEETGVTTHTTAWCHVCTLRFPYAEVEFFAGANTYYVEKVKTTTDETVHIVDVAGLSGVIENLPPLIELSLQRISNRMGLLQWHGSKRNIKNHNGPGNQPESRLHLHGYAISVAERKNKMIPMPEVIDMLLAKTEPGPVSEWTERIASVARAMELPLCNIEWNGTPKQVAHSLVGYSFRYHCSHDQLLKYL